MKLKPTVWYEYSTEGAPLLIADLKSAAFWRGTEPTDEIIVEYMGKGVDKLPKELFPPKKPGRAEKKFKKMADARAFADKVIAALRAMNPGAAPRPSPDAPQYYLNNKRVFSVEARFSTAFDVMLKSFKKTAAQLAFDKKQKAEGVFLEQEGAGPGLIGLDLASSALVVTKLSGAPNIASTRAALEARNVPATKGSITLDGRILIFDSAYSEKKLADVNWGYSSLTKAGQVFDAHQHGPLKMLDTQRPCVAFARLRPGKYNWSFTTELSGADENIGPALWLTPA